MSDTDIDNEQLRKWMLDNYPNETVFISQITENVNDIFQHLKNHPNFKFGESKPLSFELTRRKETDYMEVQMSPASMIFLGGLAKAISDVIISEILPNMIPQTKQCNNCNTMNNKIANYCYQCGNKI